MHRPLYTFCDTFDINNYYYFSLRDYYFTWIRLFIHVHNNSVLLHLETVNTFTNSTSSSRRASTLRTDTTLTLTRLHSSSSRACARNVVLKAPPGSVPEPRGLTPHLQTSHWESGFLDCSGALSRPAEPTVKVA